MIAWLYNLIVGHFCRHNWETVNTREIARYYADPNTMEATNEGRIIGMIYILRCKKCGNIKQQSINIK